MLTRRDFIRVSSGVAAGAVVAGLGISTYPTKARAEVALTAVTVGAVIAGILAAYGIGTTNYNLGVELGIPEMLGNAFLTFSQDAQNYNRAVTAANSRISEIPGGVGFTNQELYDSISSASYMDGLSVALDPSAGLSLDWLNARGVEQAGFLGMLNAFLTTLNPSYPTFDYGQWKNLIGVGVPVAAVASWCTIAAAPSVITDNFACPFEPAQVFCWYQEYLKDGVVQPRSWHIVCVDNPIPYYSSRPSDINTYFYPTSDDGISIAIGAGSQTQAYYWNVTTNLKWNYKGIDSSAGFGTTSGFKSETGLLTISGVTPDTAYPQVGNMAGITTDVGDVGFGGAIIGDGFTADNGMITGFGTLPVFDPAYSEGTFPGVIDYPYPSALLDWRTGVFNPNDVLSSGVPITDIPGVAAPVPNGIALPTDIPVTVGIPISDGISVPSTETLTLDDIISSGIATSISKGQVLPVPVEGSPFYPVNPPGSNPNPPSDLPLGEFPFQNVFPFNMLFEWLKWIRDNI